MIRGALILAVGFTLGYVKALQENEDVRDAVTDLAKTFKNAASPTDEEMSQKGWIRDPTAKTTANVETPEGDPPE